VGKVVVMVLGVVTTGSDVSGYRRFGGSCSPYFQIEYDVTSHIRP
jgi:hypothetical protein